MCKKMVERSYRWQTDPNFKGCHYSSLSPSKIPVVQIFGRNVKFSCLVDLFLRAFAVKLSIRHPVVNFFVRIEFKWPGLPVVL